jgi:DNA-damage-inducible protein D
MIASDSLLSLHGAAGECACSSPLSAIASGIEFRKGNCPVLPSKWPKIRPMKRELIARLHRQLEELVHKEIQSGTEFWLARDLQVVLDYKRWANFTRVIERAMIACEVAGYDRSDHFLEVRQLVSLGDGSEKEKQIEDFALTRYACYLIAQNADSSKDPVAIAQTYFAMQTRRQEMIESWLADQERLDARKKLSRSEKVLSGLIYEHVENEGGFSRIRIKGDQALFGGVTTRQMKRRLQVPKGRALADFLPTITIKAKDFANEITNFSIKRDYLHTEAQITREHIKNNRDVRKLLQKRRIVPEELPAAEDVKKVERRLASTHKKLPHTAKRLEVAKPEQRLIFETAGPPAKILEKRPGAAKAPRAARQNQSSEGRSTG